MARRECSKTAMPLVLQDGSLYQPVESRPELVRPLAQVMREAVESALILCGGNRAQAARKLGISYQNLRAKVAEYRREDA